MEKNKERSRNPHKEYIKVNVLMKYGDENVKVLIDALNCENTNEKLNAIQDILEKTNVKEEEKVFIVQKLLSYPFIVRQSIAKQLEERLNQG